jgi:uncharacterized sporulation protein YeaH/YhbH (DUF444 family)
MSQFIDKRHTNRHKSAVNRRRFLQRFKSQIRKSVTDAIVNRNINDFQHGEKIRISNKDTTEPAFNLGRSAQSYSVLPGNKSLSRGDKIPKPQSTEANANGNQASNSPEIGEDNFGFEISRDEFLNIFFDDLELPNLIKKQIGTTIANKRVRAGHTSYGAPTNINIVRTMRNALARRIVTSKTVTHKLKDAEQELHKLLQTKQSNDPSVLELQHKITQLKQRIEQIPYIDPFDVKYNRKTPQRAPTSKAVAFCLMDVSGSMDEVKKNLAKRFFILLYLFLTKHYEITEIVFIRHHTSAKEVAEQEFFYSRETGGTVVSSALELMADIIHDRYPTSDWNIYGAQASDGDNWNNDSPHCKEVLQHKILPKVQFYAYVEILPRNHQSLWEEYLTLKEIFPNFDMQSITTMNEIYPVFKNLFRHHDMANK